MMEFAELEMWIAWLMEIKRRTRHTVDVVCSIGMVAC